MVIKTNLKEFLNNITKFINPNQKPYLIAITGGSGSGKTYIAKLIQEKLNKNNQNTTLISLDDYYKTKPKEILEKDYDFDNPKALDLKLLNKHLKELHQNKTIKKPLYDFKTSSRKGYENLSPSEIIIIEGLFSLNQFFLDEIDLKIYIHVDEDIMLQRRIKRDIEHRGQKKEDIINQWKNFVYPAFETYIQPQIKNADIIIENN